MSGCGGSGGGDGTPNNPSTPSNQNSLAFSDGSSVNIGVDRPQLATATYLSKVQNPPPSISSAIDAPTLSVALPLGAKNLQIKDLVLSRSIADLFASETYIPLALLRTSTGKLYAVPIHLSGRVATVDSGVLTRLLPSVTEDIVSIDITAVNSSKVNDILNGLSSGASSEKTRSYSLGLYKWQNGVFIPVQKITGRRNKLFIHGILSTALDAFGNSYQESLDSMAFYNAVRGAGDVYIFNYDWKQSIKFNGQLLASLTREAESIEVFAHSMGTLVTLSAIDQSAVPLGVGNSRTTNLYPLHFFAGPLDGAETKLYDILTTTAMVVAMIALGNSLYFQMARTIYNFASQVYSQGIKDLKKGSSFLEELYASFAAKPIFGMNLLLRLYAGDLSNDDRVNTTNFFSTYGYQVHNDGIVPVSSATGDRIKSISGNYITPPKVVTAEHREVTKQPDVKAGVFSDYALSLGTNAIDLLYCIEAYNEVLTSKFTHEGKEYWATRYAKAFYSGVDPNGPGPYENTYRLTTREKSRITGNNSVTLTVAVNPTYGSLSDQVTVELRPDTRSDQLTLSSDVYIKHSLSPKRTGQPLELSTLVRIFIHPDETPDGVTPA